jgi:carbonyl reductase 1
MSQRVAVVTGANKGIGYAIVQGLVPKFDGIVYLTGKELLMI